MTEPRALPMFVLALATAAAGCAAPRGPVPATGGAAALSDGGAVAVGTAPGEPGAAAGGPGEPGAARPPVEEPVAPRVTPDAEFRTDRPPPARERPFKVPAVKRFKLKNGLPVILAESRKLPLYGLELVVKTGNAANPRGQAGLADLTAAMLDEGTTSRGAVELADELATAGASLAASAGWDASSLSVSGLSDDLDRALAVWAEVLLRPAFDDKELARVRANLAAGMRRRKDNPAQLAAATLARALYGADHPYGWPVSGTEESIGKLTGADLRKFWETYYRPNNAVLVVAGDVNEKKLRAKLEPLLKDWKARPIPKLDLPAPAAPAKTRVFLVDRPGAPQSSIRVGLVGLERRSPDYHAALVMNQILGGSFKRLGLNLRRAKGWTGGVSSLFEARRTPGPWWAGGEFIAAHTADAIAELLREVKLLRDELVTDKELDETKDEIVNAFPTRFATVNQVAGQMAALAVYGLPDNDLATFTRKISAVTRADVQRVARKYLDPDRMAIAVVADQKAHEAALRKVAEVEVRDPEGNPLPAAPPSSPSASAGPAGGINRK